MTGEALQLKPGTPCYLVHLTEHKELSGRVVEVVAGPLSYPDDRDEPSCWYEYTAAWSREMFAGRMTVVLRRNLRPIVPPELESPATKRTQEPAH